ncbi:hypothetical protein A4H97_16290 [Niastella yeongjuensis]|uniref:Uncharacterized protein n=1 Tax=Niastella yeongjuensis TaxID=354355 RepID=A0A1V9E109_9BACT|nr:hypothetical protein [Niastella yeongjuensis]OQP39782.1 hypothetical protein A4H97_16290 [Niastella yeongjuensis]SEO05178.1 hypothetical protein SAMN05660816_02004 [Niastella yeongjuensis]
MKYLIPSVLILLATSTLKAQTSTASDSPQLPGDNFSLSGALDLFKKAGSPEDFEKLLNSEDSKVNNLDLNEDGNTDYIKVVSKRENDVEVFVLQDIISETESQDIAVIELQKTGNDNAVIDIVGDEDIYGQETIVEPEEAENAFNEGTSNLAGGPNMESANPFSTDGIIVNVWAWPCVRFVYAPSYVVWVSPYTWRAHPVWYRPWRPMAYTVYRPIRYHYRAHYAVVTTRRVVVAQPIYRPMRVTSVTVTTRHQAQITTYRARRTTRTTVVRSNNAPVRTRTAPVGGGNNTTVHRRTTTVSGPHGGQVNRTTTTVKRRRR